MKAISIIKSHILQRLRIILSASLLIALTALLIIYIIFLSLPGLIIAKVILTRRDTGGIHIWHIYHPAWPGSFAVLRTKPEAF